MDADGKTVAAEGLSCMESRMKELGLAMNLRELGATEEMLEGIATGTAIITRRFSFFSSFITGI